MMKEALQKFAKKYLPMNYGTIGADKTDEDETLTNDYEKKGYGTWIGAAFVFGQLAGVGMLNLPQAVAHIGWSGIGIIVLADIAVGYLAIHLSHCWNLVEQQTPYYKNRPCGRPYGVIAQQACGKYVRYTAEIVMWLALFGTACVELQLMADILQSLLSNSYPNLSVCPLIYFIGIFLTPFTFLCSPKDFWLFSIGSVITIIIAGIIITIVAVEEPPRRSPDYPTPTFISFFMGLGSILFSFGGVNIFPTIQNDMRDKSKFTSSIKIGFISLLVLYISVSVSGYTIYGSNVENNILFSMTGTPVQVTETLLLGHLLFSFFFIINPVMQGLDELFNASRDVCWHRMMSRGALMALVIVTTEAMPQFDKILGLLGGFSVSLLTFILPPIFFVRLSRRKNEDGVPYRVVSSWELFLLSVVVIVGIFGGIATTFSAIEEFFEPDPNSVSCF